MCLKLSNNSACDGLVMGHATMSSINLHFSIANFIFNGKHLMVICLMFLLALTSLLLLHLFCFAIEICYLHFDFVFPQTFCLAAMNETHNTMSVATSVSMELFVCSFSLSKLLALLPFLMHQEAKFKDTNCLLTFHLMFCLWWQWVMGLKSKEIMIFVHKISNVGGVIWFFA